MKAFDIVVQVGHKAQPGILLLTTLSNDLHACFASGCGGFRAPVEEYRRATHEEVVAFSNRADASGNQFPIGGSLWPLAREVAFARAYAGPSEAASDRAALLVVEYAKHHGTPERETTVRIARDAAEDVG